MQFNLVYENSGDTIEFKTKYNADLIEWFIDQTNRHSQNKFSTSEAFAKRVDQHITQCHWALSKTNEVLYDLIDTSFAQNTDLINYLDQNFLNKQHRDWVFSQQETVDIDALRASSNSSKSALGWKLHDIYPDDTRNPRVAEVLKHLGYIYAYEEVNMSVHRLEKIWADGLEFTNTARYEVVDNPFAKTFTSNNDVVNFYFGYTYVGRQYYNKWQFWDTNLKNDDHYNYETLEWAFQVNLDRPQTIPYSPEFLNWCKQTNALPISNQIPIANVVNLEDNLHNYRHIIYRNSKNNNQCHLKIV
tara:strand:- start:385 stop:1290 length:906 start_codon:yes stop_codon:yes gene_type:complete